MKRPSYIFRSSHPEMFVKNGALKICSKFTGEHLCRSVISIMLLCNFIEISLWHEFPPVNLLHIFKTLFPTKTSGRLFLKLFTKYKGESEPSQTSKVDRRFCEKKPLTIFAKKLDLGCFTDSEYTFITKQNHIISFDTETILLRLP